MTPAEANAKALAFALDRIFAPRPKPMTQAEMAQLWLEDLAQRASAQEAAWYRRSQAANDLAYEIEEARYLVER